MYIHVYEIIKNRGPGLFNSPCHADNIKHFMGLSLRRTQKKVHMFHLAKEVENFGDVLAEKKVALSWLLNSYMVKPETINHLNLVYYFKVP